VASLPKLTQIQNHLFQGRNIPRLPRFNLPEIPQHVIQGGNNRQPCFLSNQDYKVYLKRLWEYSSQFKVAIHSYVLMTNHVHLLATPETGEGGLV
jgi:putative transposase